jgi:hypothetical protein
VDPVDLAVKRLTQSSAREHVHVVPAPPQRDRNLAHVGGDTANRN